MNILHKELFDKLKSIHSTSQITSDWTATTIIITLCGVLITLHFGGWDGQRQHLPAAASKWSSGCTKEWKVCLEYIFHIITPAHVSCSCRLSLLAAGVGSVVFCCCSRSAGAQGCYNERVTVSQLQVAPASAPLSLQRREEIRLLCLRMALNIEFLLSRI